MRLSHGLASRRSFPCRTCVGMPEHMPTLIAINTVTAACATPRRLHLNLCTSRLLRAHAFTSPNARNSTKSRVAVA